MLSIYVLSSKVVSRLEKFFDTNGIETIVQTVAENIPKSASQTDVTEMLDAIFGEGGSGTDRPTGGGVSQEVIDGIKADLKADIDAETTRATAAEATLKDAIDAEVVRATAAEQELDNKITALGGIKLEKDEDGLIHIKDHDNVDLGSINIIPHDRFLIAEQDTFDIVYDPLGVWRKSDKIIVPGETNNWEVDINVLLNLTAPYHTQFGFVSSGVFTYRGAVYKQSFVTGINTSGVRTPVHCVQNVCYCRNVNSSEAETTYTGEAGSGNYSSGLHNMNTSTELTVARVIASPITIDAGVKKTITLMWTVDRYLNSYHSHDGTMVFCFPKLVSVN